MDTPIHSSLNEQHIWGGNAYHCYDSPHSNGHHMLIGRQEPQTWMLASSSDDLFYPASSGPSPTPYSLLNVHFHHNQRHSPISHIPINRDHLSRPPLQPNQYPTSHSSYNNPSFTMIRLSVARREPTKQKQV